MVAVEAGSSQEMAALSEELTAEFDQHLAELQAPNAREAIEAAMASRGRVTPRPKAGAFDERLNSA
jgi:hypothetical protein